SLDSFRGGVTAGCYLWPAILADTGGPRQLVNEWLGQQQLAVGPIEDIEKTVAVALRQQLSRPALKLSIDKHRNLNCVPVMQIMWSVLVVPMQFAGRRPQRQHRGGV